MFAHLHCHFLGSYSDSLLNAPVALRRLKEMGQPAVAITDHGELAYCLTFYRACRQLDLHPVLGCEFYFVADARAAIERKDGYRNHLILLAKDNRGFSNLIGLNNAAWLENNYGEVRGLIDWELLGRFHAGLIALSGCFWGSLPRKCVTDGFGEAERELRRYLDIFGRDFYPELGRHGIEDEEEANAGLIELSRRYDLKPVVTNDCHYLTQADWEAHDVLIKTRFGYPTDFSVDARNYYLKSEEEMRRLGFPARYYDQTWEIARECRVDLENIEFDDLRQDFEERDAVFPARLLIIDTRQALEDTASVIGVRKDDLKKGLDLLPPGVGLEEAARNVPLFGQWLKRHPRLRRLAGKLENVPRASEPDFEKLLSISLTEARNFLPLKRSRGEIMVQYPERVLKTIRVPLRKVSSLRESQPAFFGRIQRQSLLNEGRRLFRRKAYADAARLLEDLIRKQPDLREARYLLGNSYYFQRRWRQAAEEYTFLEDNNFNRRKMPLVLIRMGWAYNWLGEPGRARRAFEKALELENDYSPALYALGVLNYWEGEFVKACKAWERFLELSPTGRKAEKARYLLGKLKPAA